jgi:hypothetical protein
MIDTIDLILATRVEYQCVEMLFDLREELVRMCELNVIDERYHPVIFQKILEIDAIFVNAGWV